MSKSEYPEILTLEEAAAYLRVSEDDLRIELEAGRLPGLRIAGKWRISRLSLDQLVSTSKTTPARLSEQSVSSSSDSGESPTTIRESSHPAGDAHGSVTMADNRQQPVSLKETETSDPTVSEFPASAAPVTPGALGRVRARIFSYNPKQGFGYARLADNRTVWVDSNHLVKKLPTPLPGDLIEFDMVITAKRGPEARSIMIVEKTKAFAELDPTGSEPRTEPVPQSPYINKVPSNVQSIPPAGTGHDSSQARPATPRPPVSINGSAKSQELYQKAALARTEGRYDEARRLFRQAIEAGAGVQVYTAFFKLEQERGNRDEARKIIQDAIRAFPAFAGFYDMYGQMERRYRNYRRAEEIFREGLRQFPDDVQIRKGLAQTLVQIGTENTLQEAGQIFDWLKKRRKLDTADRLYHRFIALQRSPRANKAYDFFRSANMRVGIAGRRDLPPHITDIAVEISASEFNELFGLNGNFLVRCFQKPASQMEIVNLRSYLQRLGPESVLGLQDREVIISPSYAFIAVPSADAVRDQVMSILSESNEAIIPLDDSVFENSGDGAKILRDLLSQYLGMRDLYASTTPVSGRRFFGRERLLIQLTDQVNRGEFIGIYGLRKIGKTSLIYQLRDEKLKSEAVAYVDLQANVMRDARLLCWELERDLYQRLMERHPDIGNILRLGRHERFSSLPVERDQILLLFKEDMDLFLDNLREGKLQGLRRLIIILDELEKMLPVGGQPAMNGYLEFFGLLRGLAQTERYRGLLSSVVLAANAAISERGYWEERENPVFALYKPVFLPPLSDVECSEMIRTLGKGMSVYWDDEAIHTVIRETGGHPFLTRTLCSHITRQSPGRPLQVTAAMVESQIMPFLRNHSDKLEQITELLRNNFPEEEMALEKIALEEEKVELSDTTSRHLLGYHLIALDGAEYRIGLNLLRRWLRRKAGLKE